MYSRIYRIIEATLGDSKQGFYSKDTDQYQFNCPVCTEENGGISDMKHNLEVNLKIGKFHCWKCAEYSGMKGSINRLVRKYGGTTLYNDFKDEVDRLNISSLYILRGGDSEYGEDVLSVKLPSTFKPLILSECRDRRITEFMASRRLTQDIIDRFSIGYVGFEDKDYGMRNRIVIPSYNSIGELNYFVGRDFVNKNPTKPKYRNCLADKKEICFQESLINWDNDVVLVEGAIDCLYYPNSISLLGKTLSRNSYLYKVLCKKANAKVMIALDSDTDISETKRIYSMLDFGRLRGNIRYIRMSEYKDFGEAYECGGKSAIVSLIRSARMFSEFELIV